MQLINCLSSVNNLRFGQLNICWMYLWWVFYIITFYHIDIAFISCFPFLCCFFVSSEKTNSHIVITNIPLRHHLKAWKKGLGRNVLTWQYTIKWGNVWSFITSSGLECRGSLGPGIPFTAFISGWGSKGGHCCLSADLCRLDFPPSLPLRLFSARFFSKCGNGCSFFFLKIS